MTTPTKTVTLNPRDAATPMADPDFRTARARSGGFAVHARHGASITSSATSAAREALDARLIAAHALNPAAPDFERRLRSARRAYFASLSAKAAYARNTNRQCAEQDELRAELLEALETLND